MKLTPISINRPVNSTSETKWQIKTHLLEFCLLLMQMFPPGLFPWQQVSSSCLQRSLGLALWLLSPGRSARGHSKQSPGRPIRIWEVLTSWTNTAKWVWVFLAPSQKRKKEGRISLSLFLYLSLPFLPLLLYTFISFLFILN